MNDIEKEYKDFVHLIIKDFPAIAIEDCDKKNDILKARCRHNDEFLNIKLSCSSFDDYTNMPNKQDFIERQKSIFKNFLSEKNHPNEFLITTTLFS